MATATVKYTFLNATSGDSDQVDQNFGDIVGFCNTQVLQRDGGTMTGPLTLFLNGAGALDAITVQQLADGPPTLNQSASTRTLGNGSDPFFPSVPVRIWGDITNDKIQFTNPNRKVSVYAVLHGYQSAASDIYTTGYAYLGLNYTGAVLGSGWIGDVYSQPAQNTSFASTVNRRPLASQLVWTGTPSADIVIRAIVHDPTNNELTWSGGQITAFMIPAV